MPTPLKQLLRLLRGTTPSAHERLRDVVFTAEYLVAGHDKRQLVRLGIRLQGLEVPACFDEPRVMKLVLLQ